ncbi:MAG: cytochrome c biogenesis protein CcdA [Thermodesulfobacteriota bacterium]
MDPFAQAADVQFFTAFLYGLLSFFTPCILPLIPGYFTFLAGSSLEELLKLDHAEARRKLVPATVAFVLGFSAVFIPLGASATLIGRAVVEYKAVLRIVGGAFIIIMGAHVAGLFRLGFLDVEHKLHLHKRPAHLFGNFLVGMAFAAGWSPCLGPMVGSILAIAATQGTMGRGFALLSLYSLGLGLPFVVLAFFVHRLLSFLRGATRFMPYISKIAGGLLVLVGIVLVTDSLKWVQFAFLFAEEKIKDLLGLL